MPIQAARLYGFNDVKEQPRGAFEPRRFPGRVETIAEPLALP
jgi:hypothetical protein